MKSSIFSNWLRPPRLRTAENEGEERHATWFELFFDLVLVLAIAQLSQNLQSDTSFLGFLRFDELFVPVWWAWIIYIFYADRFDTDDVIYRTLVMVGMLAIGAMATSLSDAFGASSPGFVISYLVVRLVPLLLYIRAARHVPVARRLARIYGTCSLLAAVFWLSSLLLPDLRPLLWGIAIVIELSSPFIARRNVSRTPMDVPHLAERFGLFTIIVLGESVVTVGNELAKIHWQLTSGLAAAGAFILAFGFWWVYFEYLQAPPIQRRFWITQIFVFGHLLLLLGLTMVAAGCKLAIDESNLPNLPSGTLWIVCGGTALYLTMLSIMRLGLFDKRFSRATVVSLALAAVALALGWLGSWLPPLAVVGGLDLIIVCLVLFKLVEGSSPVGQTVPVEESEALELK